MTKPDFDIVPEIHKFLEQKKPHELARYENWLFSQAANEITVLRAELESLKGWPACPDMTPSKDATIGDSYPS